MFKLSLKNVLIFPYVTLVVLLALAIGILSYMTGHQAVKTLTEHMLEETLARIGQAVDRHVVGSVATLEAAFPNGMPAPPSIEADLDNLRTRFWIATSLHIDPNNYVYYGNIQGQAFGLYRHSYEDGEIRIKYLPEEHRKRYRIAGIDAEPVFASTENNLFDPRTRPWFQAAQSSLQDIWTSVYIDFGTQDLVATRTRRVLDRNGELQGVVATDMPLSALNQFVSALEVSPNGLAFIIEPDGDLIASSCSPNVRQSADGKNLRVNAAESGHRLLTEIYRQLQPRLHSGTAGQNARTLFFTDSQGDKISVAFAFFQDKAGLQWINIVALPDSDYMGEISENVLRTLAIAVLATIIVALIGLSILHWVTKDLRKLSAAVNKVGSGSLEKPLTIRRSDEIGSLAESFSAMQYRLQTDHLTGLPNRYAFEQHLALAIDNYPAQGKPFAIMFIDINNFKQINDRYGHDAGDRALIEFALRLRTHIRQQDLVARFAGDEFVILVHDIHTREDLEPIRHNLETALEAPLQCLPAADETFPGAIGCAQFPDEADNFKDLLMTADRRMYAQKERQKQNTETSCPDS